MKLPKTLNMHETMHGMGAKGMAFYRCADQASGVRMQARRESRMAAFVETFTWDYLPGQVFASYGELREAAKRVTDEDIAAEKLKYPYVRDSSPVQGEDAFSACRLCKQPARLSVHVARNWEPANDHFARLCQEHQHLAWDAKALMAALQAEVDERRARAASKGLIP